MNNVTLKEIAWLAGLLEGEGSFTLVGAASNKQPKILLQMTDRDVVAKAKNILGGNGYIGVRIKKAKYETYGKKTIYLYGISSSLAIRWMEILLPHMGERRSTRIKEILEFYYSKPRRRPDINTVFPTIEAVS